MKTILTTITACVTILLMSSCNQLSQQEEEFDTLMHKIIGVHDEVMPKMSEMSTLIKELESKIDTTTTGKSHANAQQDLKDSYDFMMTWMGDFSTSFPHGEENTFEDEEKFNSKMKILKEEEVKVNKLKEQINSSIDNAKKLLEKS
ncbi:hypothetical protein [Aquimarina sp. 2201CG5-10]|uniref:hypothetical protein n=1 Tax=Aquimarina callyspongiae TaxID=3098150 RepID=UPI002AB4D0B1|nr:hypothetical protein [Aquimarina sp. 2201CG5-10]MDY8137446.1 hypothetical protein [Aquimarina sp. 2201CG5-10]